MRLQHLKDLTGPSSDSDNNVFLSALSSLLMLVRDERTPPSIRPYFFGATLFALDKNDRGVSAVGCTLHHLAAKLAMNKVLVEMADLLAPDQLGFGVSGGAEAAVNSGRLYLHNIDPHQALLKLDFMHTFNSVCRDKLLAAVHDLAPPLSTLLTLLLHPPFGETRSYSLKRESSRVTLWAFSFLSLSFPAPLSLEVRVSCVLFG